MLMIIGGERESMAVIGKMKMRQLGGSFEFLESNLWQRRRHGSGLRITCKARVRLSEEVPGHALGQTSERMERLVEEEEKGRLRT